MMSADPIESPFAVPGFSIFAVVKTCSRGGGENFDDAPNVAQSIHGQFSKTMAIFWPGLADHAIRARNGPKYV